MKSARGQERASGLASPANGYPSARQGLRHPAAQPRDHKSITRLVAADVRLRFRPDPERGRRRLVWRSPTRARVRCVCRSSRIRLAASTPASPAIAATEGSRRGRSRHRVAGDAPAAQVANTRARTRTRPEACFGVSAVLRAELRARSVPLPVRASVARYRLAHRRTCSREDREVRRERHRTSCQWPSVSPYGGHEISRWRASFLRGWLAVKSPHSWPSNLPTGGLLGVRSATSTLLKGERDDLGTAPS